MKSRESKLRLRRFEVERKRQKMADLEAMIADFGQMIADLERQIEMEQNRAGVSDINHFAYPTFAKAARQRRDNLVRSIEDLELRVEQAREDYGDAVDKLDKATQKDERDQDCERTRSVHGGRLAPFSPGHRARGEV